MSTLPKLTPARKVPYTDSVTVERIKKISYGLALWAPSADKVKAVVNAALNKGAPFACLIIPSCLVHLIPESPRNMETLDGAARLVLLHLGLMILA